MTSIVRTVAIRDAAVTFRVLTSGQGPDLVYFHSFLDREPFPPFLERLAGRHTVYAPLHPGSGGSTGIETLEDLLDLTLAYDERFAIGFIGSSGAGGAKIHRRNFGEMVENVAGSGEYHWMAGNYLKYAGPLTWNDLPVDSHELVALCAPRPVFIGAGTVEKGDGWVDAKGSFLAAAGAGPVYELLGKKGVGTTEFPAIETALIDGDVGFRQHSQGHTPGPNWPTYLTFAGRYIKSGRRD